MSPQVKRNQTASPGITSAVTCRHQWQDNSRRYASLVQSRQTTALSPSSLRTSGDLARKPPRVVPKTREAGGIFSCTEWLRKSGNVGRAGGSQAGMRVLLPGEGARDYSSLLKGAERLKGQVLESRVATAEAAVRRTTSESHASAYPYRGCHERHLPFLDVGPRHSPYRNSLASGIPPIDLPAALPSLSSLRALTDSESAVEHSTNCPTKIHLTGELAGL